MCIGNLWTAPYDCIANLRDGGVVGEPGGVAAGAGSLVGARGAALVRDLGGHLRSTTTSHHSLFLFTSRGGITPLWQGWQG